MFPDDDFVSTSRQLKQARLEVSDFEQMIASSKKGDFRFCDPPYTAAHNTNGFIKYNETLFSWSDQLRLHDCLMRAHVRGVKWLCTNAAHSSLKELYSEKGFSIEETYRSSVVGGNLAPRGKFGELLISNYTISPPD